MTYARQPDGLPTNKAAVALLIPPAVQEIWTNVMPDIYPPLAGEATAYLAAGIVGLIVVWFVPDRKQA